MSKKLSEIKGLQPKIKVLLETFPEARDNDNLLYSQILLAWLHEQCYVAKEVNCLTFLQMFARNKSMPKPGSVVRARALLQERHPELRGEYYGKKRNLGNETRRAFAEMKLQLDKYDPKLHRVKLLNCYCGLVPKVKATPPDVFIECPCGERSQTTRTADLAGAHWNLYISEMKNLSAYRGIY